jgi:hypothetical protein
MPFFWSFFSFWAVLQFELRAYTLSHSISTFLLHIFKWGHENCLPGLSSNPDPPDLMTGSMQLRRVSAQAPNLLTLAASE